MTQYTVLLNQIIFPVRMTELFLFIVLWDGRQGSISLLLCNADQAGNTDTQNFTEFFKFADSRTEFVVFEFVNIAPVRIRFPGELVLGDSVFAPDIDNSFPELHACNMKHDNNLNNCFLYEALNPSSP